MEKETARIEAVSDGVFAIAITLLILEIKVPLPGAGALGVQLAKQWPSYLAFFLSFLLIGIMWINHHRLFNHIKRSDNVLVVLNLLLLLGVTAVPYPTAVLAQHIGQSGQRVAMLLFNATFFVTAILFNILWRYCCSKNNHLMGKDVDTAATRKITSQYLLGPLVYAFCMVLGWISVRASLVLNVALALYFLLPPSQVVRAPERQA